MSGYREALEAAGANVLAFEHFGDWQGSWLALVEYNGERGWVHGSYGSCDHCDAFEAEFGYDAEEEDDYPKRLASFGESYLGGLQTTDTVAKYFDESGAWDLDAENAANWLRATGKEHGVE
jgi:hypothetical protein